MQVNSTTAGSAVVVMTSENFERFVCGGRVADRRHLPGEPNPCLYAHCSSDKFEDFDRVFFFPHIYCRAHFAVRTEWEKRI